MTDIVDELADLHKQATTDRSHFYTGKVILRAMQEIEALRSDAGRPSEVPCTVVKVEFIQDDGELLDGTYVTVRADDPDLHWRAGKVAVRYIRSRSHDGGEG